jgi:hypothetical protein
MTAGSPDLPRPASFVAAAGQQGALAGHSEWPKQSSDVRGCACDYPHITMSVGMLQYSYRI